MEKFDRLTGIAAPLLLENINTDAIIPVPWIVNFGRDLGHGLFGGWRYDAAEREKPDFVLNQPPYRETKILLAGRNFGCGSSREEAVWALLGFGIRCVIAPSFGDIFFENSFKNGLLPVVLEPDGVAALARAIADAPSSPVLTVDLEACTIDAPRGAQLSFAIQEGRRRNLLLGLDEIGQTLTRGGDIDRFQAADRARRPWIYRERAGAPQGSAHA
jgi:3-isopropylmalate/(R)-2-methylmalate dehydratase small subunit